MAKLNFPVLIRWIVIVDIGILAAACLLLRSDAELLFWAELEVVVAAGALAGCGATKKIRRRLWIGGIGILAMIGIAWAGRLFATRALLQLILWGFALSALPTLADARKTLTCRSLIGAPAIAAIALAVGLLVNFEHCDLARNGGFYALILLAVALSWATRTILGRK